MYESPKASVILVVNVACTSHQALEYYLGSREQICLQAKSLSHTVLVTISIIGLRGESSLGKYDACEDSTYLVASA